jgi:hypothetical protein
VELEFETVRAVCVTRSDWLSALARFETSTNHQEKQLARRLRANVWPIVMEQLNVRECCLHLFCAFWLIWDVSWPCIMQREDEQLRALNAVAPGVKRSSRLATRESEKQKQDRGAATDSANAQQSGAGAEANSSAKAGRAARAEQRAKKLEDERIKREIEEVDANANEDDAAEDSKADDAEPARTKTEDADPTSPAEETNSKRPARTGRRSTRGAKDKDKDVAANG